MRQLKDMPEGTRFDAFGCTLISRTSYEGKLFNETILKYRHVFETPAGQKLVYTGDKVIGVTGRRYDVRATIKRQEPAFFCTRIARPVLTACDGCRIPLAFPARLVHESEA